MSLRGVVVAVTSSRKASELARIIERYGGVAYIAPTIGIEPCEINNLEIQDFVRRVIQEEVHYAVFMTKPGVHLFMSAAQKMNLLKELVHKLNRIYVVARSGKPLTELKKYGVKVDLIPNDKTAKGIAKEMEKLDLKRKRVAILWHGSQDPRLRKILERSGAEVMEVVPYRYTLKYTGEGINVLETLGFRPIAPDERKILQLIQDLVSGRIGAITFTSPPSVRNLFTFAKLRGLGSELRDALNENVIVAVIGPSTKEAVEEQDVKVDVIPANHNMGEMVKLLAEYVGEKDLKRLDSKGVK